MPAHATESAQHPHSTQARLVDVLQRYLQDPTASWGLGTFGAVAEFHRTADEPVRFTHGTTLEVVTNRGAVRITPTPELRAFAYELPGGAPGSWHHAVALCLPAAHTAMHRRAALTECGPDHEALRPEDRDAVLFDMGLNTEQVDVCVRAADPEAITALRTGVGLPPLAPENTVMRSMPRLSPHRVFLCRFARLEVYQRIPAPNEEPPIGPHTHVLPNLLRHQRTHAATVPLPEGWIPSLHLYPASPLNDALGKPKAFDRAAYEDFQPLLQAFGDPELWQIKTTVTQAVRAGQGPESVPLPTARAARATVRVAVRQLAYTDGDSPALTAWRQAWDRSEPGDASEDDETA